MIRHIFKLIWNRKRSLAWIFIEQMLVFGVLLFIFVSQVDRIKRYYSKGTIHMENVAAIGFVELDKPMQRADEEAEVQFRNMIERMKQWQTVELITANRRGAIANMGNQLNDSISFRENRFMANIRYCDENYYRIFLPKLSEGAWFRDSDVSEIPPALITQLLADNIGLTGSAIGQNIYYNGRTFRIIGVVEAFKTEAAGNQLATMFIPIWIDIDRDWEYAVKYKSEQGADFTRAFMAEFSIYFPHDQFQPMIMDFSKFMGQINFINYSLTLYFLGIPTAFLLIFAFMGTFGVVWMQSKKRISEMGLRIALGCSPARLQRFIIFENLTLTTIAMLPGLIIAANLYAFSPKGWEWLAAVGAAIVLMWLFSAFSAWYPARQASKVQPVEALKANQ